MSVVGNVDQWSRESVSGWAADPNDPDAEVEVVSLIDGTEVGRTVANLPRPDLRRTGRFGGGNHGFALRLPPLPVVSNYQVSIRPVGRDSPLPNGTRVFEPTAPEELERQLTVATIRELIPIIVTHIPRSGSTLLMDILSKHNKVVVARHYPYEVKVAMYYALAAQVMTAAGDHERSGSPTEFMRQSVSLPFDPYNHPTFYDVFGHESLAKFFFDDQVTASTKEFCRSMVTKYYHTLAIAKGTVGALYFAEKCELSSTFRSTLRSLFPRLKELVLVRDLRDTYCSYKKYFAHSDVTPEYAMQVIRNSAETLIGIKDANDPDVLFVRYEDCLLNASVALRGIYEFLGLEMGPISVGADQMKLFDIHATSSSPAESIGRWKHDLVGDELKTFHTKVGPFLEAFGYDA
jgi:hypothetical protein